MILEAEEPDGSEWSDELNLLRELLEEELDEEEDDEEEDRLVAVGAGLLRLDTARWIDNSRED